MGILHPPGGAGPRTGAGTGNSAPEGPGRGGGSAICAVSPAKRAAGPGRHLGSRRVTSPPLPSVRPPGRGGGHMAAGTSALPGTGAGRRMRRAAAGREEGARAGPLPAGDGRGGGGCASGPGGSAVCVTCPGGSPAHGRSEPPCKSSGICRPGPSRRAAAGSGSGSPAAARAGLPARRPSPPRAPWPEQRRRRRRSSRVRPRCRRRRLPQRRRRLRRCSSPSPPARCLRGAASWRGADTGGSRCLHRRGPAMARPQEPPQEPPFRLRIHSRCGNTPLLPSSSGGSRPQLPAARLPPWAQRPLPPRPGKDRAPPGPGRGGGPLTSPFPLQGVCVGAGGGGRPCCFPSGVCARRCRRPLPHGHPAPPASRGQRGRRAHAPPRPARAAPGKSGGAGRSTWCRGWRSAGGRGDTAIAAGTPERGRTARARGAGVLTELLLRPVESACRRISWVGNRPTCDQTHHLVKYTVAIIAMSSLSLHTSSGGDSTTSPSSPFQCLLSLSVNKFPLMSKLSLPLA